MPINCTIWVGDSHTVILNVRLRNMWNNYHLYSMSRPKTSCWHKSSSGKRLEPKTNTWRMNRNYFLCHKSFRSHHPCPGSFCSYLLNIQILSHTKYRSSCNSRQHRSALALKHLLWPVKVLSQQVRAEMKPLLMLQSFNLSDCMGRLMIHGSMDFHISYSLCTLPRCSCSLVNTQKTFFFITWKFFLKNFL